MVTNMKADHIDNRLTYEDQSETVITEEMQTELVNVSYAEDGTYKIEVKLINYY